MNRFPERKNLAAWRLLLYGVAAGVGMMLVTPNDSLRQRFLAGLFGLTAIGGFGLLLNWSQSSQWMRRHAYWLIGVRTFVTVLAKLCDLLFRK
jgi:hypothetical protein